MFCSVIIPTIGRPTLGKAVASVLAQDVGEAPFELIVVNDSGEALPPDPWQRDGRVRLLDTNRRWQSVARNAGAAVAAGEYLLFLDDDDWLLPGALAYFRRLARQWPDAGVLCGAFELVDQNGVVLHKRALARQGNCAVQLVSGLWMQIASVAIRADLFFAVGGFSPLLRTSEDLDLLNRLSLRADFAGGERTVAQVYRGEGRETTVDYSLIYETNRRARDKALRERGAFRRLLGSADSGYWHGRLLRLYAVAALWHWRHDRFLTGVSRSFFALAALFRAGPALFSPDYWRAVGDTAPRE